MKRHQDPRWFLILTFLVIIGSVPLIQMIKEMREGQGVQALEIFGQKPTAENLRNFERGIESANWFSRMTRPWVHFAQFTWLRDGADKVVIGKGDWYFYKPALTYTLARPERSRPTGTNDPMPAILDFRDQLAELGIRLVIMPVPNKESIYPDQLTSRAGSLGGVTASRTKDLLERLRAADVEVIDLFKVFTEARERAGSVGEDALYLKQDTHWSPQGVDLAAKTAANHLMHLGWVQQGQVEYDERPAPVRRLGDIVRMLQVPMLEREIQPELVQCAQVIRRENGAPYQDAAEAEILLLGDSFLRIYQQDDPTAAGFIAHLAKELRQPMMALVNDGGGSTLVRQELRARPAFLKNKKIVIWEFVERDIGLGVQGWKSIPIGPID